MNRQIREWHLPRQTSVGLHLHLHGIPGHHEVGQQTQGVCHGLHLIGLLGLVAGHAAGVDRALQRIGGLVTVSWEREHFGSIGLEALFTGRQALTGTLTPNPYRTMSPSFLMFGVLLERQVGPVTVFLNGENLTDRRLTRFQPLVLPAQAPDGRWTTDAWGPLDGRVISLGVRWRFGELSRGRSTEDRDDDEPSDLERPILDDSGKP